MIFKSLQHVRLEMLPSFAASGPRKRFKAPTGAGARRIPHLVGRFLNLEDSIRAIVSVPGFVSTLDPRDQDLVKAIPKPILLSLVHHNWDLRSVPGAQYLLEAVQIAVRLNGLALQHAWLDMRGNPAIVLAAVRQNGLALQHAALDMRADPEIVLAAVRQNPLALQHAALDMRGNNEVVLVAVRQNPLALRYAALDMRGNNEVVLAAVRQNGLALQHAALNMRADLEIVLAAVRQNPLALQYAALDLRVRLEDTAKTMRF